MRRVGLSIVAIALVAAVAAAQPAPEEGQRIRSIPTPPGDHWVWVTDFVFKHSVLFDGGVQLLCVP